MQGETGVEAPPQAPDASAEEGQGQGQGQDVVTSEGTETRKQAPGHENNAPHFVAPMSYLHPVSRGQQQSGGTGSRPGTRHSGMTPLDKEQREGLVRSLISCKTSARKCLFD